MAGPAEEISSAEDPRIAAFRNIRERDLTGRQNRFIAEGSVVLTMLAEAHRQGRAFAAEKILLLKNRVAGLQESLAAFPADVPLYVADAPVLEAIVGFDLHRGVLALGRRLEEADDLQENLPASALVVVACGISNHDNIGAIFRNAAAFGADALFLDETCCDPLYRKALRVSVGSVLTLPHRRGGKALDLLEGLARRGFDILTLSPRGRDDIRKIEIGARVALVLGTEGEGLPEALLERFQALRIPQAPGLDSLNVATATGIALFSIAARMPGRLA